MQMQKASHENRWRTSLKFPCLKNFFNILGLVLSIYYAEKRPEKHLLDNEIYPVLQMFLISRSDQFPELCKRICLHNYFWLNFN